VQAFCHRNQCCCVVITAGITVGIITITTPITTPAVFSVQIARGKLQRPGGPFHPAHAHHGGSQGRRREARDVEVGRDARQLGNPVEQDGREDVHRRGLGTAVQRVESVAQLRGDGERQDQLVVLLLLMFVLLLLLLMLVLLLLMLVLPRKAKASNGNVPRQGVGKVARSVIESNRVPKALQNLALFPLVSRRWRMRRRRRVRRRQRRRVRRCHRYKPTEIREGQRRYDSDETRLNTVRLHNGGLA